MNHPGSMIANSAILPGVLFCVFFALLFLVNRILDRRVLTDGQGISWTAKQRYLLVLCLFVFFLAIYLTFARLNYPGAVMNDTMNQLNQYLGNHYRKNDNPYAVTVIYGMIFDAGRKIAGANTGVLACVVLQCYLMAIAFADVCLLVTDITKSRVMLIATIVFYAVIPTWAYAAQCLLKDSLHVSLFVIFFAKYIRMFREKCGTGSFVTLAVWMLIVALTRKATWYIVLLCGVILILYHFRRYKFQLIAATAAFMAIFMLYENVLLPACGIGKASIRENYALQFQQLALIGIEHGDELTEEEIATIDAVLDYEQMKEVYDPDNADPVKNLYHLGNEGSGELTQLLMLHRSLMTRYPLTCLKAVAAGTWKYFYPPSPGTGTFRTYINENDLGISHEGINNGWMWNYGVVWTETPGLSLLIGPGLYAWIALFALCRAVRGRSLKGFMIALPIAAFAIGMLATPINGEARYAYPVMAVAPCMIACSWICVPPKRRKRAAAAEAGGFQ